MQNAQDQMIQEAIAQATFDDKVEQAVRQAAEEQQDAVLLDLVAQLDDLRAEGKNVIFRIDNDKKSIAIVEFEEVSVPLTELLDEMADLPEGAEELVEAGGEAPPIVTA